MFQNIDWAGVIINSIVSLLLSFIMFSFGIRSGKERTERLKLRDKYREMYSTLNRFHSGITDNKPLNWRHFSDSRNTNFKPFFAEMVKQGEHLELYKKIFPSIVDLEKECLRYGWNYKEFSASSGDFVISVLEKCGIPMKKETYSVKTMIDKGDNKGGSYFEINPVTLLSEYKCEEYLKRATSNNIGISFKFNDQSTVCYSIEIRSCDMKHIDLSHIFKELIETLENNKPEFLNQKDHILKELDKKMKSIGKLTQEPHPFWNTFANTFKDLFR